MSGVEKWLLCGPSDWPFQHSALFTIVIAP